MEVFVGTENGKIYALVGEPNNTLSKNTGLYDLNK